MITEECRSGKCNYPDLENHKTIWLVINSYYANN